MLRTPDARFAAVLASVSLIGPLAVHLFLPVMPQVKAEFGVSNALIELTFSVTLSTMAVMTLVYGSVSDRLGRRPALLMGLLLFVAGSAASAVAGSMATLIIGRLIQAVGAASGVILARAIARDAYGPDRLVSAIAYLTMAYTLGPMLAPAIGGFLVDTIGWRSVLWFAVLAGLGITLASYVVLYETHERSAAVHGSPGLLGGYASLFRSTRFTAFVLQSGFCSGSFFALAAASPFLMMERLGRSATEYGFYFFLFPAGYFIGNFVSTRLSRRVSIETMVLAGSILNVVALAMQAALILAGYLTPLVIFLPGLFTTLSQGLALPNAQAGAMQVVPGLAGTAAGVGVFFQLFFSAVFAQIYGIVANGTPIPMVATAAAGAILALVAGAVPYLERRRGGLRLRQG